VRIFAAAFSLLGNRDDEEEIAQDTFIRAHRSLARFRGDSSLATWLHRIAINLSSNRPTPRRKTRVSNFPNSAKRSWRDSIPATAKSSRCTTSRITSTRRLGQLERSTAAHP